MDFEFLIPYIKYLVYLLLGLLVLYVRTLVTEKAKIKALKDKTTDLKVNFRYSEQNVNLAA